MTIAVVEGVEIAEAVAGGSAATGVGNLLNNLKNIGTAAGAIKSVIGLFHALGDSADKAAEKIEYTFTKPLAEIETFSGKIKSVTDVNFDTLLGQAVQLADQIHDVSVKTGIAAEDLSVMNVAAANNGVKFETLASAIGGFEGAMDGALGSNSGALQTFNALGVTWDDLRSKSPRDVLLETATGLQKMTDPATRAAAAQELFGDKAQELLPTLLSLGGDGFRKTAAEAEKMGQIMSGTTGDAADQFGKNLEKVKGSLVGAALSILGVMMPAITELTNRMVEFVEKAVGAFNLFTRAIPAFAAGIAAAFGGIGNLFKTLTSGVKEAFSSGDWSGVLGKLQAAVSKEMAHVQSTVREGMGSGVLAPESQAVRKPLHPPAAAESPSSPTTVQIDMRRIQNNAPQPERTTPAPDDSGRNRELLESAERQLDLLKQQKRVTDEIDASEKIRIEHDNKIANLHADIQKKIADIPKSMNAIDASKLEAVYKDIEKIQASNIDKEAVAAQEALIKKANERLEVAMRAADQAARDVRSAERSAELEALRGDKIKSAADVQRIATLERDQANDDYVKKIEEIEQKSKDASAALGVKPIAGEALTAYEASVAQINAAEALSRTAAHTQLTAKLTQISKTATEGELQVRQALHYRADLEVEAEKRRSLLQQGTDASIAQAATIEKHITAELAAQVRLEAATKRSADAMSGAISTAIEDALKGENFDDVLKSLVTGFQTAWKGALDEVVKGFMENIGRIAAGQAPLKNGEVDKNWKPTDNKIWAARAFQLGTGAVAIGMSGYQAGLAGEGGRTGGTLAGAVSGAAMGAQIGTALGVTAGWGTAIGAVLGAVVGAVGAYIGEQQRQADYKYGIPTIDKEGTVTLDKNKNMSPGEMNQWITKIGETYRTFWNGYVDVLLKLPGSSIPTATGITGKFQDNPSGHYLEHLQQWVEGTLPDAIADQFKNSMKSAFVNAGVLAEGFDKFWDETTKMDPKRALQFWSDLADGLSAFSKATSTRANVDAANGDWANTKFLSDGTIQKKGESDFTAQLRTQTQGIFDVARQMVNLTGPEKVAAWKQLGASVQQVMGSLTEYLNRVGEAMRNARETIDNATLERKLQVLGQDVDENGNVREMSKHAQVDLLMAEFDKIVDKIKNAKDLGLDPETVNSLLQNAIGLQDRAYQIDPNDPRIKDRVGSLAMLDEITQQALKDLADEAKASVDKFVAEIDPFKQWLLGVKDIDIQGALNQVTDSFPGFAQAIDELAAKLGVVTNSIGTTSSSNATVNNNTSGGSSNALHVMTQSTTDGGEKTDNVISLAEYIRTSEERQLQAFKELQEKSLAAEKEQRDVLAKLNENKTPVNVTVNVNGTNYGVDELEKNVTAAAMAGTLAAIQSDPSLIDHPYAVGS